jgi:hypothetical protein
MPNIEIATSPTGRSPENVLKWQLNKVHLITAIQRCMFRDIRRINQGVIDEKYKSS